MVSKNPTIERQPLRTTDGEVFAVLLSAEEFAQLQAENDSLREQAAMLLRQKNHYLSELERIMKSWVPLPPTEEELKAAIPNSEELAQLIADLESR
jgi:hypothetical protein